MEELIKVTVKNDQQLVSARDLYKGLEINRKFSLWVKDNFKSFIEHEDFEGVRKSTPYMLKVKLYEVAPETHEFVINVLRQERSET